MSTPSATVRMPSDRARLIVDRTTASSGPPCSTEATNERSSFSSCTGIARSRVSDGADRP